MFQQKRRLLVAATMLLLVAAGCSSSSKSTSSSTNPAGSSSNSGPTYTVGLLTDLTGAGSNTFATLPQGIKAGVGLAKQEGYNINVVQADTTTSPTGALTGAQKLVEQNHVEAVFMTSLLGFGAAPYLASHGIPVYGASVDGTEWNTNKNMFSVLGYSDYTKVESTWGEFYKKQGVTNLASVGYGVEPSSIDAAKGFAVSAQHQGIKVGYLNTNFPLGSTNVTPIVLAMKDAGVNGLATGIVTNSSFALVRGLEQQGVKLKAGIPATGYGGDLVQGGPGAQQDAQGLFFSDGWEPVEMHTGATQKFQNALRTYAGVSQDPTFAEYIGYLTVDAFVQGLKAAGSNPTQSSLINATLGITHYGGQGLWGSHTIGFDMPYRGTSYGADNCIWFTKYVGTTFHLVSGADPLCGNIIPGVKLSGSS
jgi:branched-chain amino acid transport system substrate-binding protein